MSDLLRTLEELPDGIGAKGGGPLRRALMRASLGWKKQVEQNASRLGPGEKTRTKSKGVRLKDNIIRMMDRDPQRAGFTERAFVTYRLRAYWAFFTELGTEKMRPRPVFRPVLDQKGREPIDVFARSMRNDISSFVEKSRNMNPQS